MQQVRLAFVLLTLTPTHFQMESTSLSHNSVLEVTVEGGSMKENAPPRSTPFFSKIPIKKRHFSTASAKGSGRKKPLVVVNKL